MSAVDRYPLSWPRGWNRKAIAARRVANFGTKEAGEMKRRMTLATATARLHKELKKLGIADRDDAILSTNMRLRFDGIPRSDQGEPDDPGAALYFHTKGGDRVLACDTWTRVADNVTAIAMHMGAMRAVDRYGVGSIEQAFAGYVGLPARGQTWRTTLGFEPSKVVTVQDVENAFKNRARDCHPDSPTGSHDAMASLTLARTEARRELGV